jgi:hypothetical protein
MKDAVLDATTMTTPSVAFQSQSGLVVRPELPGHTPEVPSKNYSVVSVEVLDAEIVASVDAAHGHYNGLRRELVLRLLPALAEMRSRHASQGARNDVNHRLGLPMDMVAVLLDCPLENPSARR